METVYVISMLLSIFCHCTGLFYSPMEARADSCVFIIVAVMFLQKLKLKYCVMVLQNTESKFLETAAICLAVQVLLLAVWFPIYFTLQLLVDTVCNPFRNGGLSFVVDKIQAYAVSLVILAMEMAVLVSAFEIDDLQRFFGTKDDLVSDSILTIVAKQQKAVQRREKLLQRM